MPMFPVLGKTPSGKRLKLISASAHYVKGKFRNPIATPVTGKNVSTVKMLRQFLNKPKETAPPVPLPSVKTDLRMLVADVPVIVWFGHSSYLIKVKDYVILVDPVFSGYAAPFSFMTRSFAGTDVYSVADLPEVDMVLLTHDHYDHLDYKTVRQLNSHCKKFCVSLGVGSHLEYWGIAPEKIVELDWWQAHDIGADVSLTATPARHFSGRTFARGLTLWSSFVLKIYGYSLFLGGDSGYEMHFQAIGEEYGPFDLAILECGQYSENWPYIHMFPEQVVRAARELGARALMPVHWGKFALSLHAWDEPIRRVTQEAAVTGMPLATPMIGEPFRIGGPYPHKAWWEL